MSMLTEPPVIDIDLTSQEFKEDPFPSLSRMRREGPVIRVRIPFFGKVWMATTYDAVNDLLRDHIRFIQSPTAAVIAGWGPSSAGCLGA